jgi:hypothetical protein
MLVGNAVFKAHVGSLPSKDHLLDGKAVTDEVFIDLLPLLSASWRNPAPSA